MTTTMTATEAQAQFFDVLSKAQAGTEIIIERDNRPIARVLPPSKPALSREELRKQREAAIEGIRQWRKKYVIGPPLTFEELMSARDEGRRGI